jgi:hypothetical protein
MIARGRVIPRVAETMDIVYLIPPSLDETEEEYTFEL